MNKQIHSLKAAIADARFTLANMRTDLKQLEKINQSHKWKSLTNPEIRKCWRIADGNILEFARAIDYLLKAKNGQTL